MGSLSKSLDNILLSFSESWDSGEDASLDTDSEMSDLDSDSEDNDDDMEMDIE
jgi:hypothetical protein